MHLISYLTNTFEQVYITALLGIAGDLFSFFFAGFLHEKFGSRLSLMIGYLISVFGGIMTLAYGLQHTDSIAFPIFFFIARFGVSGN